MQPVNPPRLVGPSQRLAHEDERAVAGMEFAIIAPVVLLLVWGVWDIARALLAWEETYHAAEAVAQAAEKLSVTTYTTNGNKPVTALTAQQMQDAMTSIYAEMPWLNLGNGTGLFTGSYSVTLSGVYFSPLCPANPTNNCSVQTPYVLWSSNLTQGGSQLLLPPPNMPYLQDRLCNAPLKSVPQFPNNSTQLLYMINPNTVPGGVQNINLIPQVVADVQLQFQPSFPLLSHFTYTFWASASFPAPLGGDDQEILFDELHSGSNNVENCGGTYNG